jgi:FkbM family methyltransferase
MTKYSQNNEQSYILNYFSETTKGKFIDIGAYDGITFSNVRALAEKGWSGVCYEADINIFHKLKENYKGFENVLCVHCAVHTFNGNIVFYGSNGDAVGTTSEKHIEKWKSSVTFENATVVRCFDVNELLDQDKDADFLNIDVEGVNIELFNHITDLNLSRFNMICVEHDGHHTQINNRLKSLGFTEIMLNGENGIYAKL